MEVVSWDGVPGMEMLCCSEGMKKYTFQIVTGRKFAFVCLRLFEESFVCG